jgi:hypothetical protein
MPVASALVSVRYMVLKRTKGVLARLSSDVTTRELVAKGSLSRVTIEILYCRCQIIFQFRVFVWAGEGLANFLREAHWMYRPYTHSTDSPSLHRREPGKPLQIKNAQS